MSHFHPLARDQHSVTVSPICRGGWKYSVAVCPQANEKWFGKQLPGLCHSCLLKKISVLNVLTSFPVNWVISQDPSEKPNVCMLVCLCVCVIHIEMERMNN